MAQPGVSPYMSPISAYQVLLFIFTVTWCRRECFWPAPTSLLTSVFVSPGTESFMDATSALHHATPGKAKRFSLLSLYVSFQTGDDSQTIPLTRVIKRHVCVCSHTVFPVFALLWAEILCYLEQMYNSWISHSFSAVADYDCCTLFFDSGSRSVTLYGASHVTAAVRYVGSPHPADGPSLSGRHCMFLSHRLH